MHLYPSLIKTTITCMPNYILLTCMIHFLYETCVTSIESVWLHSLPEETCGSTGSMAKMCLSTCCLTLSLPCPVVVGWRARAQLSSRDPWNTSVRSPLEWRSILMAVILENTFQSSGTILVRQLRWLFMYIRLCRRWCTSNKWLAFCCCVWVNNSIITMMILMFVCLQSYLVIKSCQYSIFHCLLCLFVTDEYIFSPWTAPLSVQIQAGCQVGQDYPSPIVDHRTAGVVCCEKLRLVMAMLQQANITTCSPKCPASQPVCEHPAKLAHTTGWTHLNLEQTFSVINTQYPTTFLTQQLSLSSGSCSTAFINF